MTNRIIREKTPRRALSREESKLVTRHRLIAAGLELLTEGGYENLTTGRVARRAGVAQPTFYVHFRDRDELVAAIAADAIGKMRGALRDVRLRIARGGDLLSLTRETYRLPLATIAEQHGDLLRLFVSELYRPHTEFGRAARALILELVSDLVEDLRTIGLEGAVPAATLALLSETVIMLTIHFGVAYVEGRQRDLDALADLLARTTVHLLLEAIAPATGAGRPTPGSLPKTLGSIVAAHPPSPSTSKKT